MDENTNEKSGNVSVNVEMSGNYDDIVAIMDKNETNYGEFEYLLGDFEIIINTIKSIDGGTKSRIISELPSELSVDIGAEELVPMLRVLETYGLVTLDGNTWTPGPNLEE